VTGETDSRLGGGTPAATAAALADRTLQLELALGILRERDKAAAEQSEWDFAADLQTSGLPNDFPPYPDRRDFDIYAGMVTCKEVGGDLYDFFLLAPDRLAFVVADAAGKGLPAAIFITLTRTLLRAAAARIAAPGECLRIVNAMLCLDNSMLMFTTAFFGVLDTSSGEVSYANAGHNPPYVVRAGGAVELVPSQGTMALGILEDGTYRTGSVRLAAGESIVCFSDGVTEALEASGELYGENRLVATLATKTGAPPMEIAAEIVGDVDRFIGTAPMADDITVLVVSYYGDKS
jgi:phosphoserine phosphatase RsbU/P